MSQQPKTETDRLANVIQVLQLGQQTGMLIVERHNGSHVEQGIITIANGYIMHASVGQRQGQDALAWLGSWGHCYFSFSTEQKRGRVGNPGHTPRGGEQSRRESFSSPLLIAAPGQASSQANTLTRTTGNLGDSGPLMPTAWTITPSRICRIEEGMHVIERMGLSRTHRRLFLLIDGRRTLQDLVRLLPHEPGEIHRLLKELARAGVVQA